MYHSSTFLSLNDESITPFWIHGYCIGAEMDLTIHEINDRSKCF